VDPPPNEAERGESSIHERQRQAKERAQKGVGVRRSPKHRHDGSEAMKQTLLTIGHSNHERAYEIRGREIGLHVEEVTP
jgi:hypothetical protein